MKQYSIKLSAGGTDKEPLLTCFVHDTEHGAEMIRPAVIICPGGGYTRCSQREGEPVAVRFYAYGFNAFLLSYSCNTPFPAPLLELAEAVDIVRRTAVQTSTAPDKVIVCGFSAGAHLACSLGVHACDSDVADQFSESVRPDAMILSYPVITAGEYAHRGSIETISGKLPEDYFSLENYADRNTPPAFIWHCADDKTVPVENSLMMAGALSRASIPFELHIFPQGGHGIALCDNCTIKNDDERYLNEDAAGWFELAVRWARKLLDIRYR